jgi:RNase H-fold protein (predicted Holliday junction resolvase)
MSKLMKALKAPSKVASALDWKKASGSILTMDIGTNDKISLCLSSHPSFQEHPRVLDAIPLKLETREGNHRSLSKEVTSELQSIVKDFNVSSFVVSFKLQEQGRAGYAAGKALHTLESILDETSTIMSGNRPFCLWDKDHLVDETDDWGRNKIFGEVPSAQKTIHVASREQYSHEASSSTAAEVWNDFCMKQWPEITRRETVPCIVDSDVEVEWTMEHYEDTEAYVSMAA